MPVLADDIRALLAIGGPLTVTQLAAALDSDADSIVAVCDDLIEAGLILDNVDGLAIDGEPLEVSHARRTLLAGRLAEALAEPEVGSERLGRLHLLGGRPDLAHHYLVAATLDAPLDHDRAIELLSMAIDSVPHDATRDDVGGLFLARARRRRSLGMTLLALEDASEAISRLSGERLVDALALASVLADDRQRPQEAERWAAMAMLEAGRLDAHPKFGSLLSLHARELARLGFAREAEAEQAAGRAIADAEGTEVQRFYTLVNAARTELDTGDVRSASVSYEHLRDVAQRIENEVVVASQEANLARALLLGGNVAAGLELVDHAKAVAERSGAFAVDLLADIALVEGLLAFHRYKGALAICDRLVETAETALPAWRNRADGYRAIALIGLGRHEEARAVIARALAETPRGADGLRLRSWLRAWAMAAGSEEWNQHEAENLTDLLIHSDWLQTAAEFMLIRARKERHPELAAEAAALAHRLGHPMLAADALEVGKLWFTPGSAVVANHLRQVELDLPKAWLRNWLELPSVRSGLAVDLVDDERAAEALRADVERALGGLDSAATALSPAQRITSGAVRRRRVVRNAFRTMAQTGVAAIVVLIVFVVFFLPDGDLPFLEERDLSGSSPFAGGPARIGLLEGSVGEPVGVYWDLAVGGSFRAAPVIFGNTAFVGSSEGRFYSIDLRQGTTTFEETADGPFEAAAGVFTVPGFGEGGQSKNLAFFAADGTLTARTFGDTGEVVWRFPTGGPISGPPIRIGQTVYFASADGHVYAVDGPSGFEVGRFPETPVEGGFTEAIAADDSLLYAVGGGDLYMIDLDTLEQKCVVDLAARTDVVTHPVVAEGAVFVGTSVWNIAVFEPGNCGAAPAGLSPNHQVGVPIKHAQMVHDGVVWVGADELLLALDAKTGAIEVVEVGGVITSPLVMTGDGTLIMATEGGHLVGVDAPSRTLAWGPIDLESEIRAPVAVVDHAIVVATARGDLIALGDG